MRRPVGRASRPPISPHRRDACATNSSQLFKEEDAMRIRIAIVTLLLVLIPVGMAMAQQPTNLYDTLAAAGNYKTFLSLVDKANVQELKAMAGPFTVFAPNDAA